MEYNFEGKRALVTGAGKGIGRGAAKALARCGAEVIALTRTQADLDTLVKEVPSIKPLRIDLSNINEAVKAIEEQGDIHLLVNNAAVGWRKPFLDIDMEQDFDKMMNINFKAAFFVAQAVARKMVNGKYGGSIVNISSLASIKTGEGMAVYGTLKAAQDMLTKVMALELGPHKIRVNSVNPGLVNDTKMASDNYPEDEEKAIMAFTPLRKISTTPNVVDAILFLLSDKAAMIDGVHLPVDGGVHFR